MHHTNHFIEYTLYAEAATYLSSPNSWQQMERKW